MRSNLNFKKKTMKRKMFLMSALALMVAGGIFWGCQKDDLVPNPQNGLMLKNGSVCDCVATFPSAPEVVYSNLTFGITVTAYNDATTTYVTISRAAGNMTIRYANPGLAETQTTGSTIAEVVTSWTLNFPNGVSWECGDPVTFSFYLNGLGGGSNNTLQTGVITYNLKYLCPQDCENWETETAFGGEAGGAGSAWWFYYDGEEDQTIWAGQDINVGTVEYTGGEMVITLTGGWELEDVSEPIKIQGYATGELPEDRPTAGLFTTYKGEDLSPEVGVYDYYVIHLDVRRCTDDD